MTLLPHLAARLFGVPLAIHRPKLDVILSVLGPRVGIADLAASPADALAFGQQRAVELARALAAEPRMLLLDEPAAGLNIYETAELGRQIQSIQERGITVLLVEHDMSLVMDICDEIVVLSSGRKLADDIPVAIQRNPEVIAVYLGEEYEPAR